MSVSSTNSTNSTQFNGNVAPPVDKSRSQLDQLGFISLLVTQLSSQNPLNPMDEKEFMSQMSQMSTVQGMQEMQASMQKLQASSLVGKSIEGFDLDGEAVGGVVDSFYMDGNDLYLRVDGKFVPFENVVRIYEDVKPDPNKEQTDKETDKEETGIG